MTERPVRREPFQPITHERIHEVSKWEADKEAQATFQAQFREFIETKPLYSNFQITLPPGRTQFHLDVARLYCPTCKTLQPFRSPEHNTWYHFNDKNLRISEKQTLRPFDLLMNGIFPIELLCQECRQGFYDFFVLVSVNNGTVMKFGQVPMWTPRVDPQLRRELGTSAQFYIRALQNLNLSYGVGACAYFRRMIEDFINPLLALLHDYKKDAGTSQEELEEIQKVIASHTFSAKTAYAAEICPPNLLSRASIR